MPLRPFPFPFCVGTDVCHVQRIRALVEKSSWARKPVKHRPLRSGEAILSHPQTVHGAQHAIKFVKKILTPPERDYFWKRFGLSHEWRLDSITRFLAGRFAAKEACRKACLHLDKNTRAFQQIVILPVEAQNTTEHQSTRPMGLILDERYLQVEEDEKHDVAMLNGQLCEISISHDGDYATAVALVPVVEKPSSSAGNSGTLRVEGNRVPVLPETVVNSSESNT